MGELVISKDGEALPASTFTTSAILSSVEYPNNSVALVSMDCPFCKRWHTHSIVDVFGLKRYTCFGCQEEYYYSLYQEGYVRHYRKLFQEEVQASRSGDWSNVTRDDIPAVATSVVVSRPTKKYHQYQKPSEQILLMKDRKKKGLCVLCGNENPTRWLGRSLVCEEGQCLSR